MTKRLIKAVTVLPAVLLVSLSTAYAIPTITLSDGATTVTVADGGAGDTSALPGVVTYNGAVGAMWNLNVTTGITKPQAGSPTSPSIELNSINASSSGPGTLTITFSEVGFGPASGAIQAQVGGVTAGTLTYFTYTDAGNALGAKTTGLTTLGPFSGAFSGTASGTVGAGSPFSLTQVATITHSTQGSSSFNATLARSAVPDAGSALSLFGSALALLGMFAPWKR